MTPTYNLQSVDFKYPQRQMQSRALRYGNNEFVLIELDVIVPADTRVINDEQYRLTT
jgi:hypothetical protein